MNLHLYLAAIDTKLIPPPCVCGKPGLHTIHVHRYQQADGTDRCACGLLPGAREHTNAETARPAPAQPARRTEGAAL